MAVQSLMDDSKHPFIKSSINHILQLKWTYVNTFWIHNFTIKKPTKSYSQQVHIHLLDLTQNSCISKSSLGGRKRKHLCPYPTSQKPNLRLNGIWSFIGPPLRAYTNPLFLTIKINDLRKIIFFLFYKQLI